MSASAWDSIFGFERVSLCDWPGMNSRVIFLGGCNMRCPTCHNYMLAWHSETMPVYPRKEIEGYLKARQRWIDGVVITGGEATTVAGLDGLIRDLHALNMPVKLDTNGMHPEVVESLLAQNLVDLFAVDVKGPYRKYPQLTGGTTQPEEAKRNLEAIFAMAKKHPQAFLFRLTHVPILTDEDVEEARSYVPEGFTLKLQRYVPPRRSHAETDIETGRVSGNLVHRPDFASHSESPEGQRH
ncbi:MAG: anaerobic ribonucleoside-triphosphate reductase activating protein [Halodesulfovibrio sp.]